MTVNAYAKINLDLYIKGRRADGYHEISTVMHSLPLCDRVGVELTDGGINVYCDKNGVPCDERNSAYRAAKAYFDAAGLTRGADITIEKKIPVEAGFGGSSTDGAAVLFALEETLGALGAERLAKIAASLSADMPFCLAACTAGKRGYRPYAALCRGIGEDMTEIPSVLGGCFAVVTKPDGGLSAKDMYARFDSVRQNECKNGTVFRGTVFYNDFQSIAEELRPNVAKAISVMRGQGADAAMMSGSGSGVFGIFTDAVRAESCAGKLGALGFEALVCDFVRRPEYIMFDLDGTLTRSAKGITNSVKYALAALGKEIPDEASLLKFVGPPLVGAFEEYCGMDGAEALEALRLYRVYFTEKGIYENEPYEGIPELLSALSESGRKVVLVSSKPHAFVEKILGHFGLIGYFHYILGATMDETLTDKASLIARALSDLRASPDDAVMVGDRRFDVEGARANGVYSIAVAYGYGSREELADADMIAETVADLSSALIE